MFYSYTMTVRASVPIMKGEQIFTSYTLPLEGIKPRNYYVMQSTQIFFFVA